MIEKLDRRLRQERDSGFTISEPVSIGEMQEKINELVDIINELQESQNTYWIDIAEIKKELQTRAENVQDKFAEQRRWIGKLCRFWDDNSKITKNFGILTRIDEMAIVPYEAENGFWYCACEPVKPDDDIIYKGV